MKTDARETPEYLPSNPKIDVFHRGEYQFSTNWFKTCRAARAHYARVKNWRPEDVRASRDKRR